MEFKALDYIPISPEAQRNIANLDQAYNGWLMTQREIEELPSSMFWAKKGEAEYLTVCQSTKDVGSSRGVRSAETEAVYENYVREKQTLQDRAEKQECVLIERVALYKTRLFHLPVLPDLPATILRKLDIEELLGVDLMVVGTTAFSAYELACGVKFPTGNEFTEDFDLAWMRGTKASLVFSACASVRVHRKTLFSVLRSIDPSYRINRRKSYQAINDANYEVELLAAPSTHPLPKDEAFSPMYSLFEQEPLIMGRPVSCVVATERGKACPLVVPDPRFMALHKLWLADKPERKAAKKEKDRRQGYVLLDAVRYFLQSSHPLNMDFVMELGDDLRPIFDRWCAERQFVPVA